MARCEKIEPQEDWVKGECLQDIYVSLLQSMLWAKDNLSYGDYVYGAFARTPFGSNKPQPIAFSLSVNSPTPASAIFESTTKREIQLRTETSLCPTSNVRVTIGGLLSIHPNGGISGIARLKHGDVSMVQYGLRVVGNEPKWCAVGQHVWMNVNDIEANQRPMNRGQLVHAIRHYFIKRALDNLREFEVPDSFLPGLEAIVYGTSTSKQSQYELLSELDVLVFNALVDVYRQTKDSPPLPQHVAELVGSALFFDSALKSVQQTYSDISNF